MTGVLLLLLAMALYRLELNEKSVSAAVIVIYVLSTLVGGIVIGKACQGTQVPVGTSAWRQLFTLLMLITLGVYHTLKSEMVFIF